MPAIIAAILFGVGLILHLVGHGAGKFVTDCLLGGLLCLALHLVFGAWTPWRRP